MNRRLIPLLALLFFASPGKAADQELRGKLVQIETELKRIVRITLETRDGKRAFAVVATTRFFDAKGVQEEGARLAGLAPGAELRLVLTASGKTLKEVHRVQLAAGAADADAPPKIKDDLQNGLSAKVVSVDLEKRTVQVQTEDGRKLDLAIGTDVKFIGPKGGVSTKGIKDDRFVVGNQVRLVFDGKTVKEIHLPIRK